MVKRTAIYAVAKSVDYVGGVFRVGSATLGIHFHIMAAGDSKIPVHPRSCLGVGGMILLLNPRKLMSLWWVTEEASL